MKVNYISNTAAASQSKQKFGSAHLKKTVEYVKVAIDNEGHSVMTRVVTVKLKGLIAQFKNIFNFNGSNHHPSVISRRTVIPSIHIEGKNQYGSYSFIRPKQIFGEFKLKDGTRINYASPSPEFTHVQIQKTKGTPLSVCLARQEQGITRSGAIKLIDAMEDVDY